MLSKRDIIVMGLDVRREYRERTWLRGFIKQNRNGRIDIACMKDLDRQFLFLLGLTLLLSISVLIYAVA